MENVKQQNDRYKQIIQEIREKQGIGSNLAEGTDETAEEIKNRKSQEMRRLEAEKSALKEKVKTQTNLQNAETKKLETQVQQAEV